MNTQERVADFFATHPQADECFEALGKVFADKDKAQAYLAGVAGRLVTTHSRDGITFERESDNLKHQIGQQQNVINTAQLAYENAPANYKEQAMGEWNAAREVLRKLESRLDKQLIMEEKDELLAKEDKPQTTSFENKELSIEELTAKISSQQATVDTNEKLIKKMPAAKKKAAQKKQEAEIKFLEKLKADLKTAEEKLIPPVVEEKEEKPE